MNPIKQFIEESRLTPNHSEYATIEDLSLRSNGSEATPPSEVIEK